MIWYVGTRLSGAADPEMMPRRLRAPGQHWRALSIKVRTTSACPDLIHVVNATIRANFLPLLALLI